MKFCVRITINQNFTSEKWHGEEAEEPVKKLLAELGDYVTNIINKNCFYFIVVEIEDESSIKVEERIKATWAKLYPDNINALNLMMIINDGTPVSEVMQVIYKVYYGWESYLELCTRMANSVSVIKSINALEYFKAVCYFVAIDSGCGFSMMTRSFGDYIEKLGIFEKNASTVTEKVIGADAEKGEIKISELMELLNSEDNYYRVVGIDISNLMSKEKRTELVSLINQLYDLQQYYIFMFRVPYLEEKALKELRAVISDVIYAEEIIIPPLTDMDIEEEIYDRVMKYNYNIDRDAVELIRTRLNQEKMDGRFYGFKTISKVCQEALWLKAQADGLCKLKNIEFDINRITKEDVAAITDFKTQDEKTARQELGELVGIKEISEKIEEIISQVKASLANKKMERPCLHMRFVGAPGTGKTTVARILGKILKEEGILRKGGFFEYAGRSLCAEYVGQTAVKTSNICRDAYGSVLFIDEAYSLYTGDNKTNDYGREALATLIAEMENHRDDMVVIMAGYDEDMEKLMEGNAGLRSRMPYKLEFRNYSREELADIYLTMAKKVFELEEGLEEEVRKYFDSLDEGYITSKEFGNARFVRNLYERTWAKASLRAGRMGETIVTITKTDFILATEEKEFSERIKSTRKIGF